MSKVEVTQRIQFRSALRRVKLLMVLKSPAASHPALRSLQNLLRLQSVGIENGIHEIRSLLLTGGYAKILLRERAGSLTAREQGYLTGMIENTRRIKDVLASLDRLASCHELNVTRFPVTDLVRDTVETAQNRVPVRWTEGVTCAVYMVGDRQKLRDALQDVLASGIWSGAREIAVRAQNQRFYLTIQGSVEARGVGDSAMESQMQLAPKMAGERVEEFEHSRDVVRLHGGFFSVETDTDPAGKGIAVVTMKLPAVAADEQEVAANV